MEVTAESLKTAYPGIFASIEKTAFDKGFSEGLTKGTDEGMKAGADKERARIKAVEESSLPGHEDLVARMKYDGVSTAETAAVKILQAEKTLRETKLDAYKADAPAFVATVDAARTEEKKTETAASGELMTEEQMKTVWNKDAKLRADFGNDFDAYKAYTDAEHAGRVKIYGQKGGK